MNDPKELQNNKLKPTTKQNLKSNKVFKEATNGQKSLSKAKKGKIVEQLDEESDEEMIGNDSVDSNDEMYYSLNVSNKSNDSDDNDVNESEDDEEEDEGEDSGDEEEDDNDREEMDDDDIIEAINRKVSRPKKKVKIDDEDDDNSDEDDANSDEDDDNSDEGSSDDSSDDEEDESSSSSSSSEEEDEGTASDDRSAKKISITFMHIVVSFYFNRTRIWDRTLGRADGRRPKDRGSDLTTRPLQHGLESRQGRRRPRGLELVQAG